jgi:hypothetical protein
MPECESCKVQGTDLNDGICESCEDKENALTSSQRGITVTPCPCDEGPTNVKSLLQCSECKIWWHPACIGLDGLSNYFIKKFSKYKCPLCFTLSPEIKEKLGIEDQNEGERETVKATVQKEVKAIMPKVVEELVAGVKSALGETSVQQMVKDANEKISKSWVDIAKTEQKRVMNDVVGKTSEAALKESLSKISADLSEQKSRQRNAVMFNVPEGHGGNDASLEQVVCGFAGRGLSQEEIAYCKRLGEKKPGKNRLVLIVLKKEDCAAELHNFGRGRKLDDGIWINPDLTRTERDAKFQERVKRRQKKHSDQRPPVREAGPTQPVREAAIIPVGEAASIPVGEAANIPVPQAEGQGNGPADAVRERRASTRSSSSNES